MRRVSRFRVLFPLLLVLSFGGSVSNTCDSQWAGGPDDESYLPATVPYERATADECGCPNSRNNATRNRVCVRKCCRHGYVLKNNMCVYETNKTLTDYPIPIYLVREKELVEADLSELRVLPGMVLCEGNATAKYTAFEIGDVFNHAAITDTENELWIIETNWDYDFDEYCFDYSYDENEVVAFVCENDYVEDLNFGDRLSFIGTMISLPFLLITFIVYALLPQRSLHGTSLMCYVFVLFVAYFLLDFSFLYKGNITFGTCRAMGMVTFFCLLSSIFWMNVMSYDIYSTFKGARGVGVTRSKAARERKRFALYSAYAWGVPLFFVCLVITLSQVGKPNAWYDPGVRGEECLLRDGVPELLYFYGPIAVLMTANIVMFAVTAMRIKKVQRDTEMLTKRGSKKHSENEDQMRFGLYIKLLFAMGLNWSVEIINWLLTWLIKDVPAWVWYVTDFCNAAYGVIIFFVFVFTKSVWRLLKKRYNMMRGIPTASQSTDSTGTGSKRQTRTTN